MGGIASYWGEIAGLLSAISAAAGALMARSLGRVVHPVMINAIRCTIAALGFILMWQLGDPMVGNWQSAIPFLFVSVTLGLVVGDSLYLAAITRIGPGRATPLAMSFPLPTAVLSVLLLDETVTLLKGTGIAVGVIGIWLIATRGRRAYLAPGAAERDRVTGTALAIAASICWAVSIVALRPALDLVSLDFANLSRMVFASVVLTIASRRHLPKVRHALASPSRKLVAVATGLMSVLTTSLLAQCVLLAGASTASLLSSMTPIFAAPLAWLLLREELSLRLVLGICLGITGISMVMLANA
jgi:drug/metabolite transporter (DMT)-like permease